MLRLDEAKAVALDAIRYGARYGTAVSVIRGIDADQDSIRAGRARGDSAILAGRSP
jgi:hypothetical protein